jgi:hypothetical protein
MRNLFLAVVCAALFGIVTSDVSAQCCCFSNVAPDIRGSRYATAYEELENADAVFYGQIVEMKMLRKKPVRPGAQDYEVEITFRVEKAWRRDLDEYTKIREYSEGCLMGFGIAHRWLVYGYYDEEKNLRTGYCTRSRVAYQNVEDDFKDFAKHNEPQTKIIKSTP